jgi:hypothetical protein
MWTQAYGCGHLASDLEQSCSSINDRQYNRGRPRKVYSRPPNILIVDLAAIKQAHEWNAGLKMSSGLRGSSGRRGESCVGIPDDRQLSLSKFSGIALSEPHRGRAPIEHRRTCFDLAIIHKLIHPVADQARTWVDAAGRTNAQGLLNDVD